MQLSGISRALIGTSSAGTATIAAGEYDAARNRSVALEGLKYAFIVWLVVRLALSAWGALIMAVAPEKSHAHIYHDYPDVVLPQHDLYGYTIGVWNIYDVRHYITIAERGYEADPGWLPAYFPGYPLLIKLVSPFLLGNSLLAALLIANACALIFFWYLYRLVEMDYGPEIARRAVLFSAIFPLFVLPFSWATRRPLFLPQWSPPFFMRVAINGRWQDCSPEPPLSSNSPEYSFLCHLFAYTGSNISPTSRNGIPLVKLNWAWLLLAPLAALAYSAYRYFYIAAPISGAADLGGAQKLTIMRLSVAQSCPGNRSRRNNAPI